MVSREPVLQSQLFTHCWFMMVSEYISKGTITVVPHMAVTHSTECLNRAKESLLGAIIMSDWNAQLYTVLAMECLRLSLCVYVCLCVHTCVHTDTHGSIYVCMCTMSLAFCPAVIKLITMAFLSRCDIKKKNENCGFYVIWFK